MVLLNRVSVVSLAVTAAMAIVSYVLATIIGRKSSKTDKLVLFWLIWDAAIHFVLEGSFIYFSLTGTVEAANHPLAELWKEYSKADRRWGVSDPTIVSLEVLTVCVCGPLCVALIAAIVRHKYYRHFLQVALCTCELYGGWVTFCPEWLVGSPSLVTSNWLYLWVYLVFFNGLWVVVPCLLLGQSWLGLKAATEKQHQPISTEQSQRQQDKQKTH